MGLLFYGPLGSCVLSLLNVGLAYVQVQVYRGHAKDSAQSVLDLRFEGFWGGGLALIMRTTMEILR